MLPVPIETEKGLVDGETGGMLSCEQRRDFASDMSLTGLVRKEFKEKLTWRGLAA